MGYFSILHLFIDSIVYITVNIWILILDLGLKSQQRFLNLLL